MNISGGSGSDKDTDFELNLASIIDCFTVLITYLLVSASFITLGVLDVTVTSSLATSEQTHTHDISLSVGIKPGGRFSILLEGTQKAAYSIDPKDGGWDYDTLISQLKVIHEKYPDLQGGVVNVEDNIIYKDVVKTIEKIKTIFTQVAISAESITS